MWQFFILLSACVNCAPNYNITSYENSVIYEDYGNSYLYSEKWTTMHYIDIPDIAKESQFLYEHLYKLQIECKEYVHCKDGTSINNLMIQSNLLASKIQTLSLLSANTRDKRGLINFIGKGLKYLFGNMDADDAQLISDSFDNMYNDSLTTVKLVKKQTTIIKNLISQLDTYNDEYSKTFEYFKNYTSEINSMIHINNFNSLMLENILSIKMNVDRLEHTVNAIELSIQADKSNIISPTLVTPKNFIKSLQEIDSEYHLKTLFPIELDNYHVLMKLSKINIYIYKDKLIYKISTAIPNNSKYKIVKLTPIPVPTWRNYFIYSNVIDKTFALSFDKIDYLYVELSTDCILMNNIYYCEIMNPVLRLKENECLGSIVIGKTDNLCTREYFNIDHTYISKLKTSHSWYILPVSKPSILSLKAHCSATSDDLLLISTNTNSLEKIVDHKIQFNHSELEEFYFKENNFTIPFIPHHINSKELKLNTLKLESVIDKYEEDIKNNRLNSFTYHAWTAFQILSYVSLTLVTLHILNKCGLLQPCIKPFKFGFRFCFDNRQPVPVQQTYQTVQYTPSAPLPVLQPLMNEIPVNPKYEF